MIVFVTLLLGLISGPIPIQVTVEGPVATVEYVLDGIAVAKAEFPPWSAKVDFGPDLQPRELIARALDQEGNEIARAVQWVNLPRPPAEVEIVLESDAEGRPTAARLAWQSLITAQPATLSVTLNGRPLLVQEDRRVPLPAYDPKATQILTAELAFAPGVVARKDVVFGGEWGSAVSTELTAVPVRVPKKAAPTPESLQGRLTSGGRPLSVAAVDDGPGKVLVVRVPEESEVANVLVPPRRRRVTKDFPDSQIRPEDRRFEMRLGEEDTIRLLSPSATVHREAGIPSELFNSSRELTREQGGLLWFLFKTGLMKGMSQDQRIADAVAVAGLQAATGNYRRAVVLVLGSDLEDSSRYGPATVRRYLESIRVPLFVWSLEKKPKNKPALAAWGEVEDISSLSKLHRAFDRLEEELKSQRVVWVEGRHLPQSIALEPGAGVELVR